ncbi:protein kinase domain containing protein, putative [Babesia bigemina]|uniref:Protein kinase domain containing protein, putative n=1 Tax=Babesia bigemina TaxID=5866 RepID=A0A061D631_BABBI|nr:protein kinase domain containing protein, putative [Babesia bigemina]CDR96161.1 protein kinase domain containing protein, putative [Babesia bigemina]|eukprot:XP_012768347.1 protein kinase domain containing protein, putative [Babesia bigemina]
MGQSTSFRLPTCTKKSTYKYFVLCTLERKQSCRILLAFRVPASSTSVDYTISDSQLLRQHGIRVHDGASGQPRPADQRREVIALDAEAAHALDHYCDRQMLCVLKRYNYPAGRKMVNMKKRAKNEANALRRLRRCKRIVTLLDAFEFDGATYYAMEYLWRGTLWSLIRRNKGLDVSTTKAYALQVAMAIDAMHRQGITHRDVTASNIMISSTGHLKIIDFNLCRLLDHRDTRMNSFLGTYSCMPPEVLHCNVNSSLVSGGSTYTKEVDWWYFGSLVYEMLTGETPFTIESKDNDEQFYNRVIRSPNTIDFGPICDVDAADLITQLMQGVPSARLGAMGGSACVMKHKFFAGIRGGLTSSTIPTNYIEARIFDCIKVCTCGMDYTTYRP